MDLSFIVITLLLLATMLLYFRVARHYSIIDKPNQRSSHSISTIRGGGIVFPIAMLLYYFFFGKQAAVNYIVLGMSAICLVSFWDDVSSLPNRLRIIVHLFSVTLMLYAVDVFSLWPVWAVILSYVIIIGVINAYNFMDGINGITGVYSLVILLSCLFYNERIRYFADSAYMITGILACLVFLFFNFRTKARCFAGDVGSVGLGYWIITLLLFMIISTGNLKFLFFLTVYGVDSILTIVHRLLLRQNIFEAHRLHFYQVLVNERKLPHLSVALTYGIVQLLINTFIMFTSFNFFTTGLCVCLPLAIIYIIVKPRIMR